jgi:hypothetical protein
MNTRKPERSPQTAAGTAADQVRVADQSFASNVSQEVGIDDVGSLIQKIGVTSTAEFEKLIGELQEARSYLESEGERIQREAVGYAEFSQAASSSESHLGNCSRMAQSRSSCAQHRRRNSRASPMAFAYRVIRL